MYYHYTMTTHFESEKNKKAFIYTAIICGVLLLLFILISWKVMPPTVPVVQDLMEINLGNNDEGFGDVQPLIKGKRTPAEETVSTSRQATTTASEDKVEPDDNAPEDAAAVNKPVKNTPKIKTENTVPVVTPVVKPQKAKITYPGPEKGPPGNNPTEDNLYKSQGKTPGKINDDGDPAGDKDTYGTKAGGKKGGPKVISGNRNIIYRSYNFKGDLPKATIYAVIKVSAAGQGVLVKLVKPSTSFDQGYAASIREYLRNMQFDKASDESNVTVQFNFSVN